MRAGEPVCKRVCKCPQGGKCLFARAATTATLFTHWHTAPHCHKCQGATFCHSAPHSSTHCATFCHTPQPVPWVWSSGCHQRGGSLSLSLSLFSHPGLRGPFSNPCLIWALLRKSDARPAWDILQSPPGGQCEVFLRGSPQVRWSS